MKTKNFCADKPYNRCLSCPHRQVRCDGPRTSAMPLKAWCEFLRNIKDLNGLTNAEIAERSRVSIKTVERLMALNCDQDIMRETARLIEDAIIGSSNQYPCFLAFEETIPEDRQKLNDALRDLERAVADNKDYRQALDDIHNSYNTEMQLIRSEAQKKIDDLFEEVRIARNECEQWKKESEHWRAENDRKGRLIDKYMEKIISK